MLSLFWVPGAPPPSLVTRSRPRLVNARDCFRAFHCPTIFNTAAQTQSQELAALVHRSRIVPHGCLNPHLPCEFPCQFQRKITHFAKGEFVLAFVPLDPEHHDVGSNTAWTDVQAEPMRCFGADRVFHRAGWGSCRGFLGQIRTHHDREHLAVCINVWNERPVLRVHVRDVFLGDAQFFPVVARWYVSEGVFGALVRISLQAERPVGIVPCSGVFWANGFPLLPPKHLCVGWVLAGFHGETPQAVTGSGDFSLSRPQVFRKLGNGCRSVDRWAGGRIEDCAIGTVGAATCNLTAPHECAAATFGRDEDKVVIVIFHDETLSVGWRHGEGRKAFTYQYKPDPQKVSTNHFLKALKSIDDFAPHARYGLQGCGPPFNPCVQITRAVVDPATVAHKGWAV